MSPEVATKVHAFFSQYPLRHYPKGQILIFGDETPEHIFYIAKGRVRKYDLSYRGDEIIVNIFKHPSFFPISQAINHSVDNFFYKTETETDVYIAPPDDALQFLKDNPDVMLDLLSRIYHGLDGLLGRMVHLMSGTARSRLLYELIIECQRFAKHQPGKPCQVTSSEVDLAARSGLSRETVSREMRKLRDAGWVNVVKGKIIVTDMPALRNAIGHDV